MKKLMTIAALLVSTLAQGQCKEVTIASNISEFYKVGIVKNTLHLIYDQAGTASLIIIKGDPLNLHLEDGNVITLLANNTVETIFVGSGGLSRSRIVPSYTLTNKDLALLSSFQIEGVTFKGVKTIIKNKKRKAKLMSLAACNIK